jgi:hypothetical protein
MTYSPLNMTYPDRRLATHLRKWRHSLLVTSMSLYLYMGCDPTSQIEVDASVQSSDTWWFSDEFDDHTTDTLDDIATFHRLAHSTDQMKILKFWITEPSHGVEQGWSGQAMSRFYDSHFYTLHDQLYWYRLLNGARIWGFDISPLNPPLNKATVQELIEEMTLWDQAGRPLPLDLKFTADQRLYAPDFYEAVLSQPRQTIVGSLLYLPAQEDRTLSEELWAFELEYSDQPTLEEIQSLFTIFEQRLPLQMRPLRWLTRSPFQAELGAKLIEEYQDFSNLIINYNDLVVPGQAEIYSDGLTAGRMHLMSDVYENTRERDVLLYKELPDDLPACRGLISSIPQTPLAHLNLLARNRGIPNIYVANLDQTPAIIQLSRAKAPVLLYGQRPDTWLLLPLTNEQYTRYIRLKSTPNRTINRPSVSESPYFIKYEGLGLYELLSLRPLIGGKAAGAFMLAETIEASSDDRIIEAPNPMLALTGRAYAEHIAPLEMMIDTYINDSSFLKERVLLTLLLEGWSGVWLRSPSANEIADVNAWLIAQPQEIQTLISLGGVQGWVRHTPIQSSTLTLILDTLNTHFESISRYQGLRFRSSSNVEDLEGFNGAGLYGSFTAYLSPHIQDRPNQRGKTVPKALTEVWASYWNLEAFEERALEGINHLDGWMGILVHPNFQDDHEISNGVMTLTVHPDTALQRGHNLNHQLEDPPLIATVTLNSQLGSESVTNPTSPNLLTELVVVKLFGDLNQPHLDIERVQRSTLTSEVLTDRQIEALAAQGLSLTLKWREADNESIDLKQRYQAFTLDFEYRGVSADWPLTRRAPPERSSRIILKQARPLEPAQDTLSDDLKSAFFPLDLQRRSLRIRQWRCKADQVEVSAIQLYTDPLSEPKMGFEVSPFTGELLYTDHREEARRPSNTYRLSHLDYMVVDSSPYTDELHKHWRLQVHRRAHRNLPFEYLSIDQNRHEILWIPRTQDGESEEAQINYATCEVETLFASPNDYLSGLVQQAVVQGTGLGSHLSDY